MKKLVVILLMSVFVLGSTFAQDNINPKVMEKRKEFYGKELLLTDQEAKDFWPVFTEYLKADNKLKKTYRPNKRVTPGNDKEAEDKIKRSFEYEKKKNALKEKYFEKFSEVLPVRKVAMIQTTERKFRKMVVKKGRQRRNKG